MDHVLGHVCTKKNFSYKKDSCIKKDYHKKVPRKQGECIFSKEKSKSFQGLKVGPGPQPIKDHFVHMTLLHYIGNFTWKKFWPPPDLNPGSATGTSTCTMPTYKMLSLPTNIIVGSHFFTDEARLFFICWITLHNLKLFRSVKGKK